MASSDALAVMDVQFITVFLGSFVAGSVLNQAKELINNPTFIISTLGTSAPLTSVFFLTFIELNVCLPALHPLTMPCILIVRFKRVSGPFEECYRDPRTLGA